MKRILLLSTLILFTISLIAQKISIEDAVMLQRSELGPEQMKQVQWVEDADLWSHIEDNTLKILSPQNKVLRSISLDELNALIEGELKSFPYITWLSRDVCYFSNGNQYYKLNVTNQTATKWVLKPSGNNIEFHEASGNFAFTKENNVVVSTSDRVLKITDLEDGIVAGQAIARSEFGIVKGLFWSPDGNSLAFYQKDERTVSEYPLVDYSTTPASVDMIRYPMAGGPGEFASAGVYNVKTGKTIYLSIPFEGPQDGFYITNIGWSPDNQFIYAAIVMRDQKSMQLIRFNAIDGTQEKVLFSETSTKYVEPEQPVIFAPG
ncbi:MAG: dipeptidyl-peptidase-4, partial [Flavobacteriales bacterium]